MQNTIANPLTLDSLSDDVLLMIFSYLPVESLATIPCICKVFNDILKSHAESLWIRLCSYYGNISLETLHTTHTLLHGVSYREIFTHIVYRYGYLVGVWIGNQQPHGDLLIANWEIGGTGICIKAFRIAYNTASTPHFTNSQNSNIIISRLQPNIERHLMFSISLNVMPLGDIERMNSNRMSVTTICHKGTCNVHVHSVQLTPTAFCRHPRTGLWAPPHSTFDGDEEDEFVFLAGNNLDNHSERSRERRELRNMVMDWAGTGNNNVAAATAIAELPSSISTQVLALSSTITGATRPTVRVMGRFMNVFPCFTFLCEKSSEYERLHRDSYARLPDHVLRPSRGFRELDGLWMGNYNSHGIEFLILRTVATITSSRTVVALKLTGDPNVPRSEISWAAYMDESAATHTCSEPEFAGKMAYRGWGQVAGYGFVGSQFIDVEGVYEVDYDAWLHKTIILLMVLCTYFKRNKTVIHISSDRLAVKFLQLRHICEYCRLEL